MKLDFETSLLKARKEINVLNLIQEKKDSKSM